MSLFQLDPASIVNRVRASGATVRPPTLSESLFRGLLGFTIVSVAGFAPWPIVAEWFHWVSELGLYLACTVVFIAASGPCLHRLIIGPGSLARFYQLFALAFIVYAIAWTVLWKWLHGHAGSIGGLLAGTALMGAVLAFAFDAFRALPKIILALFLLNTIGFYAGGWVEGKLANFRVAAMLIWGVFYGLGFGAGLGLAFYFCQEGARAALKGT